MRKLAMLSTTIVAVCLMAPAALCQSNLPGYYPIEELGLFTTNPAEVDIDLSKAMISIVAGATREESPEFADLVSGIDRIRVMTGPLENVDLAAMQSQMELAISQLESDGWSRAVKVNEDDESVAVYLKQQDDMIVGLTVLVLEDDEAALVNIAGTINPETLGQALSGLGDIPDLEAIFKAAAESEG